MKILSHNPSPTPPVRATKVRAFTLVELMVTMAIFMLMVLALVGVQIFGFKMNAITASKLKSTSYSLKALDQIQNQVRNASLAMVGTGTSMASFTGTGTNGPALMISLPTGGSNLLYLDTSSGRLKEIFSSTTNQVTLATNIVNQTIFQTVNFQGNNSSSSGIQHYGVKMTLQFVQTSYRVPTNVYEYYNFQTVMTPRSQ